MTVTSCQAVASESVEEYECAAEKEVMEEAGCKVAVEG